VSYRFPFVQLAMRRLLSWFVVHLMPNFSLIDSELTCWGLLDVHSPEGGHPNPSQQLGGLASSKGASCTGRGDGWAPPACGGLAGWSCVVASPEGGVLVPRFFQWLSGRRLNRAMCCLRRGSLSCLLVCLELLNTAAMLVSILDTMFCLAWQFSRPSCMSSCGITFADAWGPKPMLFLP